MEITEKVKEGNRRKYFNHSQASRVSKYLFQSSLRTAYCLILDILSKSQLRGIFYFLILERD